MQTNRNMQKKINQQKMNNMRTETTRELSNERGRHVRKESTSNNIKGKQL